jgi:CO dehydrogenase nickel-insertion accessory protein CooC1
LLGELEADGRVVVFDMEAGVGTLLRMSAGQADLALVVAEPTVKSLEAARRHAEAAAEKATVLVVANKLRDEDDLATVARALGGYEVVAVPDDEGIARADREGRAAIDVAPDGPGVRAIASLAERVVLGAR